MGIYDRQYYRDDEPRGFHIGGQRMMVTNLVIINVAFYLANLFLGGSDNRLTSWMSVTPETIVKPWLWWQFVSYGFAHSPRDMFHLIFNMFGLWMFGRDVEMIYGRREFLRLYLLAIVLGGIVWGAHAHLRVAPQSWPNVSMLGASGGVTAVILLFVFHYPKRTILLMMVLPVPAWVVGILIVASDIWGFQTQSAGIAHDVHLTGAAFALCYFKFRWNIGRLLPALPAFSLKSFKRRPKLRVHNPEKAYHELDREADRVLDKLHRDGETSLTARERRILEDYSRRMRQKHS